LLNLRFSLVVEATEDANFFGFLALNLEGFSVTIRVAVA